MIRSPARKAAAFLAAAAVFSALAGCPGRATAGPVCEGPSCSPGPQPEPGDRLDEQGAFFVKGLAGLILIALAYKISNSLPALRARRPPRHTGKDPKVEELVVVAGQRSKQAAGPPPPIDDLEVVARLLCLALGENPDTLEWDWGPAKTAACQGVPVWKRRYAATAGRMLTAGYTVKSVGGGRLEIARERQAAEAAAGRRE